MRYPEDMARDRGSGKGRRPGRGRIVAIVVVVVVVALLLSLRAIAGFFTDYLWFDAAGAGSVWATQLKVKVGLAAGFTLAFFVLLWVNLVLVDRLAPRQRTLGPDEEFLQRYDDLIRPRQRMVRFAVAVLFALIAGVGASGQWANYLLFWNGGSFGQRDPLHGQDIGFYVFRLPFLTYLVSWAFASLLIVVMVVAVSHYLAGGIRLQARVQRVTPEVKAHLSVLLGLLALTKAADYALQRYALTTSTRGVVQGATYTDVNAQLPALGLLILISVFCAVLFVLNIRQQGWALPVVAIGLWVLVSLVAGEIYPWFIQSFQVSRKESAREAPFIERNIKATRQALGLSGVKTRQFDYQESPPDSAITSNAATISNIRLLDPTVVSRTFRTLETQFNYFRFNDLDVDRYQLDGQQSQVLIAARELNRAGIPQDTWEARHLIYTHGYGLALAPANAVTSRGRPRFLVAGVPLRVDPELAADLPVERPELYFGEGLDGDDGKGYAIVGTTRREQSGNAETRYEGKGGVPIKGFLRRAAFALRFGDLEVLTSEFLTRNSRVLFKRDVATRVRQVAPYLSLDRDPYPVIVNGRIVYVVDGYTTANTYPYAEHADTSQLDTGADLYGRSFNYLRNSVKATVDAYDGTVRLYLVDELYGKRDPVIRAWASVFPRLYRSADELPPELKEHLRYPEDMFRIQTTMWGRYHVSDAEGFYTQSDRWDVAQDPGNDINGSAAQAGADGATPTQRPRIEPYYLQMVLPDEERESFVLFRPFVPHSDDDSKQKLTSFMVGESDPNSFGRLVSYELSRTTASGTVERNRSVDGPLIVNDNIISSTKNNVSQNFALLNTQGSRVDLGNMLIIPIDRGLLYVRPVYVRGNNENSVPELRKVVVVTGQRVEVGDTLAEALGRLFPTADILTQEGSAPGVDDDSGDDDAGGQGAAPPSSATPAELITQALQLFDQADAALKAGGAGSLAEYQEKLAEAQRLLRQASDELGAPTPSEDSSVGDGASATTTTVAPTTTR